MNRVTREEIWTTHAKTVECPECNGEGRRIEEIPGGTWNSWVGTWEPAERDAGECEECNGTGDTTIRVCDRCNLPDEDNHPDILREHGECQCDEETMLAFHSEREAA